MSAITFVVASKIVADALAEARKRGCAPMTAAVLDPGGHLVALGRDDNSSLLRPQIAIGKAWGVLGMGFGGRELARRAEEMPDTSDNDETCGGVAIGSAGLVADTGDRSK